ncbi:MAG: hypothetical protein A2Z74_03940 [Chloroflexi bacterium RBG_13_46_9]|nr:MAG: hypothetical protein A2Z74_03940 [Chloroflexi bacterium RBG_13_46_9]
MTPKKTVYCVSPDCNHGKGNILLILHRDNIFHRLRNPEGNYWEKLTVRIPGINIDLSTAALVQRLLPANFYSNYFEEPAFKHIVLKGNTILVGCRNSSCQMWNEITVGLPGTNINFDDAAVVSEDLPVGYHLDIEPAAEVVIG